MATGVHGDDRLVISNTYAILKEYRRNVNQSNQLAYEWLNSLQRAPRHKLIEVQIRFDATATRLSLLTSMMKMIANLLQSLWHIIQHHLLWKRPIPTGRKIRTNSPKQASRFRSYARITSKNDWLPKNRVALILATLVIFTAAFVKFD